MTPEEELILRRRQESPLLHKYMNMTEVPNWLDRNQASPKVCKIDLSPYLPGGS
jgi:hypothetical protein